MKAFAKSPARDDLKLEIELIDTDLRNSYHSQASLEEDPQYFFKYANSKRKTQTKIGPLQTTSKGITKLESGHKEMAEILSSQYQSVFTKPKIEKIKKV